MSDNNRIKPPSFKGRGPKLTSRKGAAQKSPKRKGPPRARKDQPPARDAKSSVKGGDARLAALDLVEAVLITKIPLDDRLAWSLEKGPMKALEPRDRAFARLIAATTLRRLGQIDALLDERLQKPLPSAAHQIRNLLRCSIAELVFIGAASHGTVSTAVALSLSFEKGYHYKGLVNAVLRRISEEGAAIAEAQDAMALNTPEWLLKSWTETYGLEATRAIVAAHMIEPPLDISTKGAPEDWAKDLEAQVLPTGTLRRDGGGRFEDLPGFKSGAIWAQDAAAAIPVKLLGNVRGQTVYDLCAAPGGKTMQLAAMGAEVTAVDISAKRLVRVSKNLKRTDLKAKIVNGDVAKWKPEAPAPFVLLDAPCTATGTFRRHPDAARLKSPEDVAALTQIQQATLANAAKLTAPSGTLVYCVCSLQKEEGPDQIEAFLKTHSEFERAPISADEIGGLTECITAEGDLRTLPSHLASKGRMDGFFAARLRRKA